MKGFSIIMFVWFTMSNFIFSFFMLVYNDFNGIWFFIVRIYSIGLFIYTEIILWKIIKCYDKRDANIGKK